jgi:uncharacterized SAM-binding protein YcdF (DUF218 family)
MIFSITVFQIYYISTSFFNMTDFMFLQPLNREPLNLIFIEKASAIKMIYFQASAMHLPRILTRKQCLVPTLWGWLSLTAAGAVLFIVFLLNLGPFLSPTQPCGAKILVVEGWLPDYALDSAAALFRRSSYSRIVVTGGVLENGSYLKEYRTYADLGAATLRTIGIPDSQVLAVPAPFSRKDRTYVSALAFAPWIKEQGFRNFDVCSLGAHSRRTRYLFQKTAGDAVTAGIISFTDAGYDPKKWWASSQGFRTVTGELIAYLYVRFIFRP